MSAGCAAHEADAKLKRLYEAIESGAIDTSDPMLKGRVAELTGTPDQARADADRAEAAIDRLGPTVTRDALRGFAVEARRRLRTPDGSLPPGSPARARAAHRSRKRRSADHEIKDGATADPCSRLRRRRGYDRGSQFGTEVARPKGFEPLTPRFVVWCSIQLSYGRPRRAIERRPAGSRSSRRSARSLQEDAGPAWPGVADGRGRSWPAVVEAGRSGRSARPRPHLRLADHAAENAARELERVPALEL
jgi:hypothetical protein